MDLDRIEQLTKKLLNERLEVRLRAAKNLLFKVESGLLDNTSLHLVTCGTSLLDGISGSLELISKKASSDLVDAQPETTQLVEVLLQLLLQEPAIGVAKKHSMATAGKILETLYQLKALDGLRPNIIYLIEQAIDQMCSLTVPDKTETTEFSEVEEKTLETMIQYDIPGSVPEPKTENTSRLHGAGAILHSRLVHSGWKFPHFVLTESDDRWIFDVEVGVKLRRDTASKDLWAVLAELPAQALLTKTNLIYAVIDMVGAPFSQADIDADPLGLHHLTALNWLEKLLRKCSEAFRVLLDGSLCCNVQSSMHPTAGSDSNRSDSLPETKSIPTSDMENRFYSLRHPVISNAAPPPPVRSHQDMLQSVTALYPIPSFPGLAFACCAASLPLLQCNNTAISTAVLSLLRTALPFVLEPRVESSANNKLMSIEQARLQHLFSRTEQLLNFHEPGFSMQGYLDLMSLDDPSETDGSLTVAALKEIADKTTTTLRESSCQLLLLSCALEVFQAAPIASLQPAADAILSPEGEQDNLVSMGERSITWLCRLTAMRSSIEAVLPGSADVADQVLTVVDPVMLERIRATEKSLHCARIFSQIMPSSHDDVDTLLRRLVARAEASVDLLVSNCPVAAPSMQGALVTALPILLLACCESESDCAAEVATLLGMISRTIACGSVSVKTLLLQSLLAWLSGTGCSKGVSEVQASLIRLFDLQARHGRHLEILLSTPSVVQALVLDTYFPNTEDCPVELCNAAINLLEVLCVHLMGKELPSEGLEAWASVLLPFKLLEWEPSQAGSSNSARFQFARRVQDMCADSASLACRNAFCKSLVLGMYHQDLSVRVNSVLRVRRDILGASLPVAMTGPNGISSEEPMTDIGIFSYDIFANDAPQRASSWVECMISSTSSNATNVAPKKTPAARAKQIRENTLTHADVRKVADIAFGELLEFSVRATAMGQLHQMLISDEQLMRTVDAEWILSTAHKALRLLCDASPLRGDTSIVCDVELVKNMSDAQCRVLLETGKFLGMIFSHFPSLRNAALFLPHHQQGDPATQLNVNSTLRVLLAACQLKKSGTRGENAMHQVAPVCAEIICMIVCSTQSWKPFERTSVSMEHLSVQHRYTISRDISPTHAVSVPHFLVDRFLFPVPAAARNEYTPAWSSSTTVGTNKAHSVAVTCSKRACSDLAPIATAQLHCVPLQGGVYPTKQIVDLIVAEVTASGSERIHVETATKLVGLIMQARNHSHLREAMASTLSACCVNPTLLHAFLYLQLNFMTAVSGIVTVKPRTHKDHITLAAALDFLHSSFSILLSQRDTLSLQLREFLTEYHNETTAAVIPQMTEYFADNFELANTCFSMVTSNSEPEREHCVVTHAVCCSYFRLVHTLSCFKLEGLTLGVQLTGSYITSLLLRISTSELHRAHDRASATSTLENLVRWHEGGWQAVVTAHSPMSVISIGNAVHPAQIPHLHGLEDPENDGDVILHLAKSFRLLRQPDSMQGTSALLGGLRLVYAIVLRMEELGEMCCTLQETHVRWQWLVRWMYDRRSEVKLLAIEILDVVLRCIEDAHFNDDLGSAVDSLDPASSERAPHPQMGASMNDINNASTNDSSAEETVWPPYELLGRIASDSAESALIRSGAINILVRAHTEPRYSAKPTIKLGSIMGALYECLSLRDSATVSAGSMRPALSALSKLITCDDREVSQEALTQAKMMKVLPLVVELLNVRTALVLSAISLERVSVRDENYIAQEHVSFFRKDTLSKRDGAEDISPLRGTGWSQLQLSHNLKESDSLRGCRTTACWLLFRLEKINPALLEQCMTLSNLVHFLVTCFAAAPRPISSHHGFLFECDTITAQAELLSLLISKEGSAASVCGPDAAGALQDYLGRHSSVPGDLLKKLILVLLGLRNMKANSHQLHHELSTLSACLRLLSLMINESLWRNQLGLSADGVGTLSDPCAYLFDLLLSFRSPLVSLTDAVCPPLAERVSEVSAVIARLDFAVAMFMQYSLTARVMFLHHNMQQREEQGKSGCSDFETYIRNIAQAADAIATSPQMSAPAGGQTSTSGKASASATASVSTPAAAAGRSSVRSATITPEAQRSLRGIKSKSSAAISTPVGTPAAAASGRAAKVNLSTSSWATRTSQSSKWRDRSRSYVWNKSRSEGKPALNPHPDALSDTMKLNLWSSLIVLSSAFPDCEQTVDWAIELRLHHSLNKLLRFAAVYSKNTLLSNIGVSSLLHSVLESNRWAPGEGMIGAAVASLCCAFTYNHMHAKQCFASTGEAAAAVINSAASNASQLRGRSSSATLSPALATSSAAASLHHLITLGTWKSTIPVTRWLYLNLAGSVVSGARNLGSPAMKSTFSQMIALALQRSLHASHSDPEAIVPLLSTLTGFLAGEEDITLLTQLSRKNQGATLKSYQQLMMGLVADTPGKGADSLSEEFKFVTFPELIQWVWASHGDHSEVAVALCKCIGRIASLDQGHKAVGNLLSDEVLQIMCCMYLEPISPIVGNLSALCLWTIVHYSEKAKGMVREILATRAVSGPNNKENTTGRNKVGSPTGSEGLMGEEEEEENPVLRARMCVDSLRVI